MSQDKNNSPKKKKPIAEEISALASSVNPPSEDETSYQQESLYAELLQQQTPPVSFLEELKNRSRNWFLSRFQKSPSLNHREKISPTELLVEINTRRAWHSFIEDEEKHKFRKRFFVALFVLTCLWLITVVYFVYQNAVSPSVEDRGKLIQIQLETINQTGTNLLNPATIRAANPDYRSALFHLSDSVLIAFITSTTVAVLGLFITAANWLYGKHTHKNAESSISKKRKEVE